MGATMGKSGSNFLDALPTQGTLHVVMLGLDSAGKTTALYRLKFDQYLNTVPTIGFNCEKVQGTIGKARGAQFLVWDVGGQEKLRPLWRSYTRCTDGILFVVDSVDVERMEEAKMELLRTAKCPDNQGVPILILANKQDLPGARDHKELEKLLGLHELQYPNVNLTTMSAASSSTGNIADCSKSNSCGNTTMHMYGRSLTPTSQHSQKPFGYGNATVTNSSSNITKELGIQLQVPTANMATSANTCSSSSSTSLIEQEHKDSNGCVVVVDSRQNYNTKYTSETHSPSTSTVTTPTSPAPNNYLLTKKISTTAPTQYKGWYIQPACAITGEGLQEGLEALYEMILKRRKLNKSYKKRR